MRISGCEFTFTASSILNERKSWSSAWNNGCTSTRYNGCTPTRLLFWLTTPTELYTTTPNNHQTVQWLQTTSSNMQVKCFITRRMQSIEGQALVSCHTWQTLHTIWALINLVWNFVNSHNIGLGSQCVKNDELEQVTECMTHTDTHESSTNSLVWGSLTLTQIIFVTVKVRIKSCVHYFKGNNKTSQYFMWTHSPQNVS